MRTLRVDLGERGYPIYIGQDLLAQDLIRQHVRSQQVLVVSNKVIADLYLEPVLKGLEGLQCDVLLLDEGEQHKNLTTLNLIFDELLARGHNRTTTLVALGGGVVGDMVGFAAACYQRGVDFIQVPTTLLSQVDSSVGGKTAVNHALGKNMIGAFYQPKAVIIDTNVLNSLPQRELSAGLAEVIKYGLIRDRDFHQWLQSNMPGLMQRNPELLAEAIERSCINKAEVVADDETEQGNRALLNFGHTFGHAIETATNYSSWLHGEAVGAGMMMAAQFSADLGWLANDELEPLRAMLEAAGLPTAPPSTMAADDFLQLMARDKKVLSGAIRLVLLKSVGEAVVTEDFSIETLTSSLTNMCG
ncbi:MAG TPA: 3-dehydroquinate synthase [Alcanivoracaceae bacterium]|nr:3-dehydroquinate synthase [Alcanivoracaceae bacterium]